MKKSLGCSDQIQLSKILDISLFTSKPLYVMNLFYHVDILRYYITVFLINIY